MNDAGGSGDIVSWHRGGFRERKATVVSEELLCRFALYLSFAQW